MPCASAREAVGRVAAGVVDGVERATVAEPASELVERTGVQAHQLVRGILVQDVRDGGGVEPAQLGRSPRAAVGARVIGQASRKRVRRRLAAVEPQRREPARAEVDRVEHEHVPGDLLGPAAMWDNAAFTDPDTGGMFVAGSDRKAASRRAAVVFAVRGAQLQRVKREDIVSCPRGVAEPAHSRGYRRPL
jgi:hypothetical protein